MPTPQASFLASVSLLLMYWRTRFQTVALMPHWLRELTKGNVSALVVFAVSAVAVILAIRPGAALMHALHGLGMQEDAMIGLRHLRNLVDGYGLVYNKGEVSLGATDPLFWLASYFVVKPLELITGESNLIAYHYAACFLFGLGALSLFLVARERRDALVAAGTMALLANLFFWPLRFFFLGLEGPFILLCLAVIGALLRRDETRWELLVCALVGVLAWNRPEIAAVAFLAFFPHLLLTVGPGRKKRVIAYVVGALLTPILVKLASGSFLPGTVAAKFYFGAPSSTFSIESLLGRVTHLDEFIGLWPGVAALLLLVSYATALIGFARFLVGGRGRIPWSESVYPAFVAGYSSFVLLVPSLWEWYISFWLGFVLVLLSWLAIRCAKYLAGDVVGDWRLAACSLAVLAVAWLIGSATTGKRLEIINWIQEDYAFRGKLSYDLRNTWKAKSVWMEAVGWQGYFNDARVYDEVGLVDDKTLALSKKYGCRYFVMAVKEFGPDFVIKRRFEVERNTLITSPKNCPGAPLFVNDADRSWFFANYERVASYQTRTPGYFGEYSFLELYRKVKGRQGSLAGQ